MRRVEFASCFRKASYERSMPLVPARRAIHALCECWRGAQRPARADASADTLAGSVRGASSPLGARATWRRASSFGTRSATDELRARRRPCRTRELAVHRPLQRSPGQSLRVSGRVRQKSSPAASSGHPKWAWRWQFGQLYGASHVVSGPGRALPSRSRIRTVISVYASCARFA
jgi:hypothetical protein